MMRNLIVKFTCSVILSGILSCGTTRQTSKYQLSNGFYKGNTFDKRFDRLYIDNDEDSITVYTTNSHHTLTDSSIASKKILPQSVAVPISGTARFRQVTFDIDFLTIPFKYRPAQLTIPRQFNTNLNGAVYIGYRSDTYQLWYKKTPLQNYNRQIDHYGFSVGFFTGLGGTAMNASVTGNQLATEYDGVVWSKGIAAIIGVNNFTIGLAFGYDDLLDTSRKYWLFQGKPWLGLAFGLNLN